MSYQQAVVSLINLLLWIVKERKFEGQVTKEMRRTWRTFKAEWPGRMWPDTSSLLSRSHYTLQEEFLGTSLLKMPRSYPATLLGCLTLICVLDLITGSWIRLSSEGRTSEAKGRVSEVGKIETLSTGTVVLRDLSRHWGTQDRLSSTNSICITSHFLERVTLDTTSTKGNETRCNFDVKVGQSPGVWGGGPVIGKDPRSPLSQKKTCQQKPTQYNVREYAGSS